MARIFPEPGLERTPNSYLKLSPRQYVLMAELKQDLNVACNERRKSLGISEESALGIAATPYEPGTRWIASQGLRFAKLLEEKAADPKYPEAGELARRFREVSEEIVLLESTKIPLFHLVEEHHGKAVALLLEGTLGGVTSSFPHEDTLRLLTKAYGDCYNSVPNALEYLKIWGSLKVRLHPLTKRQEEHMESLGLAELEDRITAGAMLLEAMSD